jgi:hypothetical protein
MGQQGSLGRRVQNCDAQRALVLSDAGENSQYFGAARSRVTCNPNTNQPFYRPVGCRLIRHPFFGRNCLCNNISFRMTLFP